MTGKKKGSVISWCKECQDNHKDAPCPPGPVNPVPQNPGGRHQPRIDRKKPGE